MTHARRALLFVALSLANLFAIWSPDVLPASLFAWTMVREGDVDYDEFSFINRDSYFFRACGESTATEPPSAPRSRGGPPAPGPNDHVCSVFPPGTAILAFPFFAPLVLSGEPPDQLALLLGVGKIVAALLEALATVFLIAAMSRIATERWAFTLGLLYLLATAVRTVSSQALWQHGAVHLLVAAALLVFVRYWTWAPVSGPAIFLAGAALGFATVVRQTSIVFAIAGFLLLLVSRRSWGPFGFGVLFGLAPLVAYNLAAFGSPLEQGYGLKPFATPVLEGLYGLLFSPSRGLFVYSPFLLFAVPPLLGAWLSRDSVAPLWRGFGLPCVALVVGYAMYDEWWGGRVFGARFLSDLLPVLFLVLAASPPRNFLTKALFALSAAWALVLHNAAALVYDQSWDTVPVNVNDDPRKLFDWAQPQWLAVLERIAAASGDELVRVAAAAGISLLIVLVLVISELRWLRATDRVRSAV